MLADGGKGHNNHLKLTPGMSLKVAAWRMVLPLAASSEGDAKVIAESLRVVVESERSFSQSDIVQILLDKLSTVEEEDAFFDITTEEFNKRKIAYRHNKEKNKKAAEDRDRRKEAMKRAAIDGSLRHV